MKERDYEQWRPRVIATAVKVANHMTNYKGYRLVDDLIQAGWESLVRTGVDDERRAFLEMRHAMRTEANYWLFAKKSAYKKGWYRYGIKLPVSLSDVRPQRLLRAIVGSPLEIAVSRQQLDRIVTAIGAQGRSHRFGTLDPDVPSPFARRLMWVWWFQVFEGHRLIRRWAWQRMGFRNEIGVVRARRRLRDIARKVVSQ